MLEKFAVQSLVEHDGELIFSKEKFAELIVQDCIDLVPWMYEAKIKEHFYGVEE